MNPEQTIPLKEQIRKTAERWAPKSGARIALIVIDMTNDGCRKGGAFDQMGIDPAIFSAIEKPIIRLVENFAANKHPVFYTVSYYDRALLSPGMRDKMEKLVPAHLSLSAAGSWGSLPVDTLPSNNDFVIMTSRNSCFAEGSSICVRQAEFAEYCDKGTLRADTVQALYDSASQHGQNRSANKDDIRSRPATLEEVLQRLSVDTLVLVGGSTHVCVAAAVYAAAERGYRVILPIDAVASEDDDKHLAFLHTFSLFNAELATVERLCGSAS